MSSKGIIVLGILATFSIIFVVAISMGYGSNNYLLQNVSHGVSNHIDVEREIFIHPSRSDAWGRVGYWGSAKFTDGSNSYCEWVWSVPTDFVNLTSVEIIWVSGSESGNMRWMVSCQYGSDGESRGTHSEAGTLGESATLGANLINVDEAPVDHPPFTDVALDDYVGVMFYRNGNHGDDTLDADVYVFGLTITYFSNQ